MKFNRLAAAIALGVAGLSSALAAPTLSILPGQQHIAVGGSASVDIVISGLNGVNEVVTAYDLDVAYNTGVLAAVSVTQYLSPFGSGNTLSGASFDPVAGTVGGDLTSLLTDNDEIDALQGDLLTLMTLRFNGLTDGVSFLNFGADPDTQRLVTGRLDSLGIAGVLDLTYIGACISVGTGNCNTVPEPGSYALAGLALLGCGLATTRRRRQSRPVAA